ncbi:hypothetical protein [Nonomuraea guangzhouensis]|uniref:NYN domain-containing protein n=1 Tax=Nonomuraea guangzhouensis TaxID=1291555 RepID=A0ABW4GE18_9ACTN|nr:hypothetical protein [Nonomuraea guangzhouensis]
MPITTARSLISRWPEWAGYAAALWSLCYGSLGAAWALGAPGFPWGASDPDLDRALSVLADATPRPVGWWIAAFGLLGTIVALMLARVGGSDPIRHLPTTTRGSGRGLASFKPLLSPLLLAWPMAVLLIIVIPDSRLMMGLAYSPLLAVAPLFDLNTGGTTLADAWPWPVVNQLVCVFGGLLLVAAALTYQRRRRDACQSCGRTGRDGWTTPEAAARWGRRAVYIAATVPLAYCATRWCWALGVPLGVSKEFLDEGARDAPGIWLAGAYLATFGAGGGLLTLGLVQRWGEVFPRWILGLRGRRVPPLLAIIPATLVAIIVTVAGMTYIRWALSGRFTMAEWGAWLPETLWPVWGGALAAAALAYHLRRRGQCRHCGHAPVEDSTLLVP